MSAIEILAVIGIIGFIIFKQLRGEALHGKRAVLLPAILTVIGFTDLHASNGQRLQGIDITWIAIGCVGSVAIGLAFGAITRLESRGGYLWAQLPAFGLWLWAAMFAWRVGTMVAASGMHAHVAASTSTLLFSLGLNRLAQAAVIVPRAMAMGVPFAPEKDGTSFLSGLFERDGAQVRVGGGSVGSGTFGGGVGGNGGDRTGGRSGGNGYGYDRAEYDQAGYDQAGYDRGTSNGRGYKDGPVDLGREFGQRNGQDRRYEQEHGQYEQDRQYGQGQQDRQSGHDSRDYDWDRSYDRQRGSDRRYDRRDRRHDRRLDRRNGRFGDRW
jgi:hypothetical protein